VVRLPQAEGDLAERGEGTYDRHSYADEKRDALEKLAALIERILNPPSSNVETLDERRVGVQS
jgi:hypothetical protein